MKLPNKYIMGLSIFLLFLSGICFVFMYYTTYSDLKNILINLGTDFIMLIFVILIVDKLVAESDNQIWSESDRIIKNRLRTTFSNFISNLSTVFEYGDLFDEEIMKTGDNDKIYEDGLKVLKKDIIPELNVKCKMLKTDQKRASLILSFEDIFNQIDNVFELFSSRLTPEVFEKLLKIHQNLYKSAKILKKYDDPDLDKAMNILGFNKDDEICKNIKNAALIVLELEK